MIYLSQLVVLPALLCLAAAGCRNRTTAEIEPRNDATPVIRSEAELAAEREARVAEGALVPTSAPAPPQSAAATRHTALAPIMPTAGAIEADLLFVNDQVLTIPEVLYPIRERISELRRTQTSAGFTDALRRLLLARAQQEIGTILIHREAMGRLSEQQRAIVDEAVDREVEKRISDEHGGSKARLAAHLREHGLTLEQHRVMLERQMVARQYAREKLLPLISISRTQLLRYYRQHESQYASPEVRELWMIEAPFEAFLPNGGAWAQASPQQQAQARLRAVRHIRAAHEALAGRPFEEVAREFSRGPHASQGGRWGEIGRPLQPPYEQATAAVFEFAEGQYSAPIETPEGWVIVRCGDVQEAQHRSFAEVQDEIRDTMQEARFERLSADYLIRLADDATVTSLDAFLRAADRQVRQSEQFD